MQTISENYRASRQKLPEWSARGLTAALLQDLLNEGGSNAVSLRRA